MRRPPPPVFLGRTRRIQFATSKLVYLIVVGTSRERGAKKVSELPEPDPGVTLFPQERERVVRMVRRIGRSRKVGTLRCLSSAMGVTDLEATCARPVTPTLASMVLGR